MKNLPLNFIIFFVIVSTNVFSQTSSWSLTGNGGTNTSNFLGTTDNKPLIFKVNNNNAGLIDVVDDNGGKSNVALGHLSLDALTKNLSSSGTGSSNVAIGVQALQTNTSGSGNIAIGRWAHEYNTTGSNNVVIGFGAMSRAGNAVGGNVAIGSLALENDTKGTNTAVGYEAGLNNTNGFLNAALGFKALWSNTTGQYNTAIGAEALEKNTTGGLNAGFGSGALNQNTTGNLNTAVGNSALWGNMTGSDNTAVGEEALGGSIDGNYNTAVGSRSLWSHSNDTGISFGHGSSNTAVGYEALRDLTNGTDNVAIGMHAMLTNKSGNSNIAIGSAAGPNIDGCNNTTAIGYGVRTTASNQVRIGNGAVISVGGYMGWSSFADDRAQKNIKTNVPGLNFINQLQPITYNLDLTAISALNGEMTASQRSYTGFSAKEVEDAAKNIGYDFSGVDMDEKGIYSLRYAEFTVPLVKAVQELSAKNEALQQQVNTLTQLVNQLLQGNGINTPSGVYGAASLQQIFPNPFNQVATIRYVLPQSFHSAKIVVTDTSGKVVKQLPLSGQGAGAITIEAGYLHTGIYQYSLQVDGKLIDTKKMIVTE